MRKEDRVRHEHDRDEHELNKQPAAQTIQRERIKGNADTDRPAKPPRPSGKLPLPD
jgi:hypothetical protein